MQAFYDWLIMEEMHDPGHEWLWETTAKGDQVCKLCGHIDRAGSPQ